jgi:2,3-bisphosphoglycerate-dependent phosphoglycerate mutase
VSDLHCAATIVVAPHGEAEPDGGRLADDGRALTTAGRDQAERLGQALAGRAVTVVYCGGTAPAVQTAEIAAGVLGTAVRVQTGLSGSADADRTIEELQAISDLHRGETVLVVSDARAISTALPRLSPQLAGMPTDDRATTGACEPIELRADADGWVVAS